MNGIGLDCGTATVKLAMLSQERELLWFKSSAHHGAAVQTVRALLGELLQADSNACGYPVMLTGSIGNRLLDVCPGLLTLGDIPAIHRGIHLLAPEAKSVIEIGSQSARFLTALDCGTPPRFARWATAMSTATEPLSRISAPIVPFRRSPPESVIPAVWLPASACMA